ncbi:MAG: metal-dependent hydrolase [Planctomycetota bacterium]
MDPLTQGLLGAVAAQAVLAGDRSLPRVERRTPVTVAGLAGGLLPDADVALQRFADPALPWELHRHFTHALVMAPVMGALAAALLLLLRPRWRSRPRLVLGAAVLGALTHAPLDLCTSYGTKILWPFSLANLTLDLFPIVDPLFTLVLLVGTVVAWRRGRRSLRPVGTFLLLYVVFALVQQHGAREAQAALAHARGEAPTRSRVMPLPGSLLLWRSVMEVDDTIVADVVRPVPLGDTRGVAGGRRARLDLDVWAAEGRARDRDRLLDVGRRFSTFADGYVTAGTTPAVLVDARFALGAGFEALWGVEAHRDEGPAVTWWMEGAAWDAERAGTLLAWIAGRHADLRSLEAVAAVGTPSPSQGNAPASR